MNELPGFAVAIPILIACILALAAILMPFAVFAISERLKMIEKILASMEYMMRNGKP
jgi:hypothetical protein